MNNNSNNNNFLISIPQADHVVKHPLIGKVLIGGSETGTQKEASELVYNP